MRALLALLLAGTPACNGLLGIEPTGVVDASLVDVDAAPRCPPIGTAPQFSTRIQQAFFQDCRHYSFSTAANRAAAICRVDNMDVIHDGPIDAPLAPATIALTVQSPVILWAAISPEGDRLFARQYGFIGTTQVLRFSVFARVGDGWQWSVDLPITADSADTMGTPSAQPQRTVLYSVPSLKLVDEYLETAPGTWIRTVAHGYADLGVESTGSINLAPDGLRATFLGRRGNVASIFYTDRPRRGERFGPAQVLMNVPIVGDPVLTDDCTRLYFTGLQSVFFVSQR